MGIKIPLQAQATKTADFTGAAFTVPDNVDAIVATIVTSDVTGTTPSLTATIQHSVDGTNWATLKAFAAKTTATAETIVIAEQRDLASPVVIGPHIRVIGAITGTTPSFGVYIDAYAKQSLAR